MGWRALRRVWCWLVRHRWNEGEHSKIPASVGPPWIKTCQRCEKQRLCTGPGPNTRWY